MKECLWLIDLQQLAESSANRQLVACRAYRGYYIGVICRIIRGLPRHHVPQSRPQNTIILIMGTPKKVHLILRNYHVMLGLYEDNTEITSGICSGYI